MKGVKVKLRSDYFIVTLNTDFEGKILKTSLISIFVTFDKSVSHFNIKCVYILQSFFSML